MTKKKKKYSIYSIRNKTSGHVRSGWRYIGYTGNDNGIRDHRSDKSLFGSDLQDSKQKFDKQVMWTGKCTKFEIGQKEKNYIKKYNCQLPNGYNRNHGGGGLSEQSAKEAWQDPIYIAAHYYGGCGQKQPKMISQKFGRLMVKSYARKASKERLSAIKRDHYYCDCDCGIKNVIAIGMQLRSGRTQSCGCLQKEQAAINGKLSGIKFKGVPRPGCGGKGKNNAMKRPEVAAKMAETRRKNGNYKVSTLQQTKILRIVAKRHDLTLKQYLIKRICELQISQNKKASKQLKTLKKVLKYISK